MGGSRKPQGYFELSRTQTYSAAIVLPLLVLYEVGAWLINRGAAAGVRNAADIALKEPFLLLGPYGRHFFAAALLLGIWWIRRCETLPHRIRVRGGYLACMLGESVTYAAFFGTAINMLLRPLLQIPFLTPGIDSLSAPARFILSLGAGLYEEFVFRVLLISALLELLQRLIRWHPALARVAAALLGSALFAAYHYVGPMGDPFSVQTFLFRMAAGVALSTLYLVRGFGIAVYTHAFYDLIVLVLLPGG